MLNKDKGFAFVPLLIALAAVVIAVLLFVKAGYGPSNLKYILFPNSQTIKCTGCYVIRIRESSWVGFGGRTGPDKIWEVEAKPGAKASNEDWGWEMEVLSADSQNATVQFTGGIYYSDLDKIRESRGGKVSDPVILKPGWFQKQQFGSGTVGGGANWTFTYMVRH